LLEGGENPRRKKCRGDPGPTAGDSLRRKKGWRIGVKGESKKKKKFDREKRPWRKGETVDNAGKSQGGPTGPLHKPMALQKSEASVRREWQSPH